MQYLLEPGEYEDLRKRAIPKETYEQWRKDAALNAQTVAHELIEFLGPLVHGQQDIATVKAILAKLFNVKLPHEYRLQPQETVSD